jgi:hypothetical protein
MEHEGLPPAGCAWWTDGDATSNPPEDEAFLGALAKAGIATYVGPTGLFGARAEDRSIVVIHRGWGRRWEVTLRDGEFDRHTGKVIRLPERAGAAIAWLRGDSLEKVRPLLETAPDPL